MSEASVTAAGFACGGSAPSWGPYAADPDPLLAAARALVGPRNQRLPRLDRPTLAALVASHLALRGAETPRLLVLAVDEGCASADRAYWETARRRGGAEASPLLFTATLPSCVAGELAMTFALRGPCLVFAGAGAADAARGALALVPSLAPGGALAVHVAATGAGAAAEARAALHGVVVAAARPALPVPPERISAHV